jgi:hypothetical protein
VTCFCSPGAGTGGTVAKDALGNDVKASEWLSTHKKGDRSLTQGLKVSRLGAILAHAGAANMLGCCLSKSATLQGCKFGDTLLAVSSVCSYTVSGSKGLNSVKAYADLTV